MSSLVEDLHSLFSYFDAEVPQEAGEVKDTGETGDNASSRNASRALRRDLSNGDARLLNDGEHPTEPLPKLLPQNVSASLRMRPVPPPRRRYATVPIPDTLASKSASAPTSALALTGSIEPIAPSTYSTEEDMFHEVPEIDDQDMISLQRTEKQYTTSEPSTSLSLSSLAVIRSQQRGLPPSHATTESNTLLDGNETDHNVPLKSSNPHLLIGVRQSGETPAIAKPSATLSSVMAAIVPESEIAIKGGKVRLPLTGAAPPLQLGLNSTANNANSRFTLVRASIAPTRPVSHIPGTRPQTGAFRGSHVPTDVWFVSGVSVADALLSFFHACRVPRVEQGLWQLYLDESDIAGEAVQFLSEYGEQNGPRFWIESPASQSSSHQPQRKRLLPGEKLKKETMYIFARAESEDDAGVLLDIKVQEWETTWQWRQKVDMDVQIEELILQIRELIRDRGQGGEGVWELCVEDTDGEVEVLQQSHFTELLEAGNKAREVVQCVLRHPRLSIPSWQRPRTILASGARSVDCLLQPSITALAVIAAPASQDGAQHNGRDSTVQHSIGALNTVDQFSSIANAQISEVNGRTKAETERFQNHVIMANAFSGTAISQLFHRALQGPKTRELATSDSKNALIGRVFDRLSGRNISASSPLLTNVLAIPTPTTSTTIAIAPPTSVLTLPSPNTEIGTKEARQLLSSTSQDPLLSGLSNAQTPEEQRSHTPEPSLQKTNEVRKIGKLANILGLDTELAISSLKQSFEHVRLDATIDRHHHEKALPPIHGSNPHAGTMAVTVFNEHANSHGIAPRVTERSQSMLLTHLRQGDGSLDDGIEGLAAPGENKVRTKKLVDFFGVRAAERDVNVIRHLLEKKTDSHSSKSPDQDKKTFLCRIYFANLTYKSLKLPVTADAAEVASIMMKRLGLADDPSHYAVFEQHQHLHHERQLGQDEMLYQVTLNWQGQETFLFRRKAYRERVDHAEPTDEKGLQEEINRSDSLSAKRSAKLAGFFGSAYGLNEKVADADDLEAVRDTAGVSIADFECLRVLGKGKFGKVLQCRMLSTKKIYAIKVISKAKMDADTISNSIAENAILRTLTHPFIIELKYAFQSPERLYLVMEFIGGGELYFHVNRYGRLGDTRARFYAAEIFLAMQFLHRKGIIYRDLKLENILLTADGHIKITDFGLSQRQEGLDDSWSHVVSMPGDREPPFTLSGAVVDRDSGTRAPQLNNGSTSTPSTARSRPPGAANKRHVIAGTLEYLAPEVLGGEPHSFASDWWAFGVVVYEMLCASHPFYSEDRHQLFQNIMLRAIDYPSYLSPRAINFLQGLFVRNPMQRLGSHAEEDGQDIQDHAYFSVVSFDALLKKEVSPTFIPQIEDELDVAYFDAEFTQQQIDFTPVAKSELQDLPANAFENFTYKSSTLLS